MHKNIYKIIYVIYIYISNGNYRVEKYSNGEWKMEPNSIFELVEESVNLGTDR